MHLLQSRWIQAPAVCLAALVTASVSSAGTTIVIEDHFTNPTPTERYFVRTTPVGGATGTNLPGGTWEKVAGWNWGQPFIGASWDTPLDGRPAAEFVNMDEEGTGLAATISSGGSYTKPTLMTIRVDGVFGDSADVGNGWALGFYSSAAAISDGTADDPSAWKTGFTGLLLQLGGDLSLVEDGVVGTPAATGLTFVNGTWYTMQYDVDTSTGDVSNVIVAGTPMADMASSAFTDAATVYAGITSTQGGGYRALFDNFCIEGISSVSVSAIENAYEDATSPVQGRLVLTRDLVGDPLVVNITVGGTAVLSTGGTGHDYDFDPVTVRQDLEVTFGAAEATAEVLVVPEDNLLQDGTRTVEVAVAPGAGYGVADPAPVTVFIFDDDSPPEAFSLVSPADGATGVPVTPTLEWEEALGATSYDVTVERVSDSQVVFTTNVADGATTSVDVPAGEALDYGTQHTWTVVAHNGNGDTPHADWGFTTEYALPTVRVEATQDAFEHGTSPVAGEFLVTRYGTGIDRSQAVTVYFTLSADPADPLGPVEAVNGTHYQLVSSPVTIPGAASDEEASVVVQILPIDDGDTGSKNVVLTLDADAGYTPSATEDSAKLHIGDDESPPLPFVLVAPGDGESDVAAWDAGTSSAAPVTLSWEAALGATTYAVQVADNPSMTDALEFPTTGTDFDVQLDLETTYYWTVLASNTSPGSTEATGAPWSFTTEDDAYAPVVQAYEPQDGATRVLEDARISILFSEPMHEVSTADAFSVAIEGGADVTTDGIATFEVAGRRLTFEMPGGFEYDTTYVCTLTNAATDLADTPNSLDLGAETELVFSFTTAEALAGLAAGEGCVPVGAGPAAALALALSLAAARRRRRADP